VSLLGRPLPPAFVRREVVLAPGAERAYVAAEWRDALVIVEQGSLELVGSSGIRRRLESGAILWLWDLPLRALGNPGSVNTRIVGISRRTDEFRSPRSSLKHDCD
jgi:hypothetical protein